MPSCNKGTNKQKRKKVRKKQRNERRKKGKKKQTHIKIKKESGDKEKRKIERRRKGKEEKKKREEEIAQLELEAMQMQKLRFGVNGDYFQKRQELIKPIQDRVYDAMQKVASKRNYTFVFDKANQSNLVYADSKYDISDEVLKEMGVTVK